MGTADGPVVVVAPDSFKGSLDAPSAAAAIARGAAAALGPHAQVRVLPMADGGEGTLTALLAAAGGREHHVAVHDAIGRPRRARYGLAGRLAVVEAAEGNGLPAVADAPAQPLRADSRGVGEIARAALDAGAEELLLCVGGSASTDGGTGLLTALGTRFVDADGVPVASGGQGLASIAEIDTTGLHPRARTARWRIAVDVTSPLVGERGAAAVFGPQKGADADDVAALEAGLGHLAAVVEASLEPDQRAAGWAASEPGYGAAGGIPLTVCTLLGAELVPGARLVAETIGLPEALADADLVLTGEGRLDAQSLGAKVLGTVCGMTPPGAALVALAGEVALDAAELREAGITAALSIARGPAGREELHRRAAPLLADATAQACALLAHRL